MADTAWQTAELKVYDRNGSTLRGSVSATGVRWTDELKGEGGASYTVPWLQSALAGNPGLLRDGIVKVGVPLSSGASPTQVFGWLSQPGSGVLIGAQEDAGKTETPACRGLRALLDDWLVLHDGGFATYGGSTRSFGWMSRTYDDSAWVTPLGRRWDADTNPSRAGYPAIFGTLDPAAQWLGKEDPSTATLADGTVRYFRGTYSNPSERWLRVYAAGDNYLDLYVNGEPVYLADESSDAYGWKDVQDPWQRRFAAGTITFAAKVRNAALTTGTNPLAFIMTVVSLDANGNPAQIVFHTSPANFKVSSAVQGLTGAKILLDLRSEAIARGLTSASTLVPSFTATAKTGGGAWPDLQERAWEIGTKGGQVVADLEAVSFDLDVRPTLALNAYTAQGSNLSATVAITQGVTLLSYSYDGQPLTATRLLVRMADRWLYLTDATAEATYQPREAFLESGLTLSPDSAQSYGQTNLGDMSRDSFSYTAVIVCTTHPQSVTPYVDFGKGDVINAYDYTMARKALQVVSISGEVPDDGVVRWTLELREP